MALAHVAGPPRPAAGQPVFAASFGEQAAGTVVNAAPAREGGFDFLVVAQIEALRAGDLHFDSLHGPAIAIVSHPAAEAA
jgi:tRNA-modifying protein YgfZ